MDLSPCTRCLGNHPNTKALKSGQVSSPLVTFDYFEVKVANTQFKALVRDLKYDLGELAIVSYLQAMVYGKPYVLLPATIVGRNQHHTIFYNADRGPLRPAILTASASAFAPTPRRRAPGCAAFSPRITASTSTACAG